MPADSEHRAPGAVTSLALSAPAAPAARQIDLPDDALALPARPLRPFDDTHELMSGNAGKRVVAALELEIGVANSRSDDAHQREPATRRGLAHVIHARFTAVENQRLHRVMLSIRRPTGGDPPLSVIRASPHIHERLRPPLRSFPPGQPQRSSTMHLGIASSRYL